MWIVAWIAAALVLALALLALVASRRPDMFRVTRMITITAPPQDIYPLIADLKAMNTWNPFALRDEAAKGHYSGAAQGAGAVYAFDGRKSGTGQISIVDVTPPRHVEMRLQMSRPMACDNRIDFILEPSGTGTTVSWTMEGRAPLFAKMMQTVIDMDRMVGRDFEAGLAGLKAKVEATGE